MPVSILAVWKKHSHSNILAAKHAQSSFIADSSQRCLTASVVLVIHGSQNIFATAKTAVPISHSLQRQSPGIQHKNENIKINDACLHKT